MSEKIKEHNGDDQDTAWRVWNEAMLGVDKFKNNAAQELMERELNTELTKVDDLYEAASLGEEGIRKITLSTEDLKELRVQDARQDLDVFLLEGHPFKCLQCDITVRNNNYDLSPPDDVPFDWDTSKTAETLKEEPAIWMKKESEVEGLGKTASATISTSYYDTEVGVPKMMGGACSYGFDHVKPNMVVSVVKGDGNTFPSKKAKEPDFGYKKGTKQEKPPVELEDLADVGHTRGPSFNEVLINRYDEQGNPQKPDYILMRNSYTETTALHMACAHASFFGVPLVVLYEDKYKQIIDDMDVSWEDIEKMLGQ